RAWSRIAKAITRRPRVVWAGTAVVLLGLAAFLPTLQAEGTGEDEVFLDDVEAVTGSQVLENHFDAGGIDPVFVITPESGSAEVLRAVRSTDGITEAEVMADDDGQPMVVDGRVQIEAATDENGQSQQATVTAEQVRTNVHEVEAQALVGGSAAERLDTQLTATQDVRTIIPLVLAVIFVMLVILLRSVVAPLVILAVNVLSFAATM